jgi:methyl-accepting chemotaxis protein
MLSAFSEMSPHLNNHDGDLGLLIERMYVGFQYQDRISQMLAVLRSDMQRLESALKESAAQGNVLDAETWLKRLESQYVMTEQHRDHQGGNGEATPLVETQNETTFF